MHSPRVHATPYSGTWYPGDRDALKDLLDGAWRESEERSGWRAQGARAFLVPHAGLEYSGTVAAAAFRAIEREAPARVVIAGFSHRGSPSGIWIPDIDAYSTPLGEVAVDRQFVAELAAAAPFRMTAEERVCDHSVEIQLPLLQRAAPGAKVVPLYVSRLGADERRAAAARLAGLLSPGALFLASSDLTHYGAHFGYKPFPADAAVAGRLDELDHSVLDSIGSLDARLFFEALRETGSTVCGVEPIALLLALAAELEDGDEFYQELLDYRTSAELTGDYHSSVSYGAAAYYPYRALELDAAACRAVLGLARSALESYHRTGRRAVPVLPTTGVAALQRRAALFVSLHQKGRLRGCLGRTAAVQSIEGAAPELALAAALEDTRFPPLAPGETDIDIEVSILSPMKLLADRSRLRPGVHGALVKAGGRQGLLLPQVASERNWGREPFLNALAAKAGVTQDTLRDPASRLYVFRAQVIH